jgi:hypothetical protein
MLHPLRMIRARLKLLPAAVRTMPAKLEALAIAICVIFADEQPATVLTSMRIATTYIAKATIYFRRAARVIAMSRHAVPNVALPVRVISD